MKNVSLYLFAMLITEHHCLSLDTHHFFFFLKPISSQSLKPLKTSNLNILNILGSESLMK